MRTSCGYEVEEALLKELKLQGFPEDISREVLAGYDIDRIVFEAILEKASIKIDEEDKKRKKSYA